MGGGEFHSRISQTFPKTLSNARFAQTTKNQGQHSRNQKEVANVLVAFP
jgi:hypothetical protein